MLRVRINGETIIAHGKYLFRAARRGARGGCGRVPGGRAAGRNTGIPGSRQTTSVDLDRIPHTFFGGNIKRAVLNHVSVVCSRDTSDIRPKKIMLPLLPPNFFS